MLSSFLRVEREQVLRILGSAPTVAEITINGNSSGNCFDTMRFQGEDVYVETRAELVIGFEGVYYRALRPHSKRNNVIDTHIIRVRIVF